jgi:hypothetical protein
MPLDPNEALVATVRRTLEDMATRGLDVTQIYLELLMACDRAARFQECRRKPE